MADNQQQQSNAFQMAADVARDAKAISKIAAKAATGNVAGAAVDTLLNPQLMKRVLCGILASLFLITCCLYAIPTMIWEAVQNVVATVSATVEDAQEAYEDNIYYVFYGSTDGHGGSDALSGIIQVFNRDINPFSIMLNCAQAAYEYAVHGELSEAKEADLPLVVQAVIDNFYKTAEDKKSYADESMAAGASESLNAAYAMKSKITRLRIGGRLEDLNESINKDAEKKKKDGGYDDLTVTTVFPDENQVILLAMALYGVQSDSSLDNVTLMQYCNWLGVSKQTWFDRGLLSVFSKDIYKYTPELLPGETKASDETDWTVPLHHWGGELLPQDIYDEYHLLYAAAVNVAEQKDKHFTAHDRYDVMEKVLNGKYKMDDKYSYPEYCTKEAYETDYSQVWINKSADAEYDRGALDVLMMPSARIKQDVETYEETTKNPDGSTTTITKKRLLLTYTVNTLKTETTGEDGGTWWDEASAKIIKYVLKMPDLPVDITKDTSSDDETQDSEDTAEYTIEPRAVMLQKPTDDNYESLMPDSTLQKYVKEHIQKEWEIKYFKEMLDSMNNLFGGAGGMGTGDGSDMIAIAVTQKDNRDSSKYCDYVRISHGSAWCAAFVSWCAGQLGYTDSGLIRKSAYSGDFWDYVVENPDKGSLYLPSDVLSGAVTPQAGDIVIWDTDNLKKADKTKTTQAQGHFTTHVGLLESYNASTGKLATIEGNSSHKVSEYSEENGYRYISDPTLFGFVRPNYPSKGGVEFNDGNTKSFTVPGLRIDTDGSTDPKDKKDKYYQSSTSHTLDDGGFLDASKVNYVVYPMSSGYDGWRGCLATIRDNQTGKVIYAVLGDAGPSKNGWGEVSIQAARSLGYAVSGNAGVDPNKKFTITCYPNCKLKLLGKASASVQSQIQSQAEAYASKFTSAKSDSKSTDAQKPKDTQTSH